MQSPEIIGLVFSSDCTRIAIVGYDKLRRYQLTMWNIPSLVTNSSRKTMEPKLAQQISEFHVAKIRFLPDSNTCLVSCGRENIRLWRMNRGHLSGRPIILNQYSRDHVFSDIAFAKDASVSDLEQFAFAASSKGFVLKFRYDSGIIICAYQLHETCIRSFGFHAGFAYSGGDDMKLRLWPLSFEDYLLEARHEGKITSIFPCDSKLLVQTSVGTIGILDTISHKYNKPFLLKYFVIILV